MQEEEVRGLSDRKIQEDAGKERRDSTAQCPRTRIYRMDRWVGGVIIYRRGLNKESVKIH